MIRAYVGYLHPDGRYVTLAPDLILPSERVSAMTKIVKDDVKLDLANDTEMRDLLKRHREAIDSEAAWKKVKENLAAEIREKLGDATAGVIGNEAVVTYRYKDSFAEKRFIEENEELAKHYMRRVTKSVLDVDLVKQALPEKYNEYRGRELRNTWSGE